MAQATGAFFCEATYKNNFSYYYLEAPISPPTVSDVCKSNYSQAGDAVECSRTTNSYFTNNTTPVTNNNASFFGSPGFACSTTQYAKDASYYARY